MKSIVVGLALYVWLVSVFACPAAAAFPAPDCPEFERALSTGDGLGPW